MTGGTFAILSAPGRPTTIRVTVTDAQPTAQSPRIVETTPAEAT